MAVNATPEGYHTVSRYLIVDDASTAIDSCQNAFGAQELYRLPSNYAHGRDRIRHAEIRLGDSP